MALVKSNKAGKLSKLKDKLKEVQFDDISINDVSISFLAYLTHLPFPIVNPIPNNQTNGRQFPPVNNARQSILQSRG